MPSEPASSSRVYIPVEHEGRPPTTYVVTPYIYADSTFTEDPQNSDMSRFLTLCWRVDSAMRAFPKKADPTTDAQWVLGLYYELV